MFKRPTSRDTEIATFSQESEAGRSPLSLPDGIQTDLFGQALAPASPSATPAGKTATQTSATYGRIGLGSSESAALQRSLVNKLQERLPLDGWMKSLMIWKRKRTPALRPYYQLAVSARPIKEIGCGLWPTPRSSPNENRQTKPSPSQLAGKHGLNLAMVATQAAMWQTPTSTAISNRSDEGKARRKAYRESIGRRTVPPGNLAEQVSMWATPSARDWKDTQGMKKQAGDRIRMDQLPRQIPAGSNAQTENPGQLNPAFVCWLMGFPPEWVNCAPLEMLSSRKSRPNSSTPL